MAKALLGAGLVEVLESTEDQDPGFTWKLDGAAVLLRITEAGLRVIGFEAQERADTEQDAAATQESCQTVVCPAGHSYVASVNDCCPNANICGSGSFTDCCQNLIEVCAQPTFGLPQCEPRTIPPPHH